MTSAGPDGQSENACGGPEFIVAPTAFHSPILEKANETIPTALNREKPTVFISHSTGTLMAGDPCVQVRDALKAALEKKGWQVFLDFASVEAGARWRAEILHALATSNAGIIRRSYRHLRLCAALHRMPPSVRTKPGKHGHRDGKNRLDNPGANRLAARVCYSPKYFSRMAWARDG